MSPQTKTLLLCVGIISAALPLTCAEHDWTTTDTLLASAYVASEMADWSQTSQIHKYRGLSESNPALGPHPTQAQINQHFAKATLGDLAIAYLLHEIGKPWMSRLYLVYSIGIEASCIKTNNSHHIHVQFGIKF